MDSSSENGLVSLPSSRSVEETVERITKILLNRGATLFALIDHSGEAEKAGIAMPPTRLLVFGNPRAGTPVMLAAPTSALDLPLKILVWQDKQGQVRLTWNDAAYLQRRHEIPSQLLPALAAAAAIAHEAAEF